MKRKAVKIVKPLCTHIKNSHSLILDGGGGVVGGGLGVVVGGGGVVCPETLEPDPVTQREWL